MTTGFWGKKIGMTQVFVNDKVVPVTVIDTASWFAVGVKTVARDGYSAIQVGCLRPRYVGQSFDKAWLKKLPKYFSLVREVRLQADEEVAIGKPYSFAEDFKEGSTVHVTGTSKGCGFAGVVRRHGFGGPPGSHGSDMGNRPGSIGHMATQGIVIKGKKLPGHMGVRTFNVRNLAVVRADAQEQVVLVKGAVPGKTGSFVFLRKV